MTTDDQPAVNVRIAEIELGEARRDAAVLLDGLATELAGEPVREDMLDFPTGWRLAAEVSHPDPRCSYVQHNGGFLCDCGAIQVEWKRRVAAQRSARGEGEG